jgi:cysteinyl-tRNA synthetase
MHNIQLHNTLSRKPEELKPMRGKEVRIYTCGPTVYNNAHIGNLRAYIFADTLVRTLSYLGYRVRHAMNITDVGHLVSDADEGEDKMDVAARREQKSPLEIARQYEKTFFLDEKLLNIRVPKKRARATETIKEQLAIIKLLEKQGYTYRTEKAVYFDTSKFQRYGELSGQKLEEKKSLTREELVEDPEKKHPQDFALWMFTVGAHAHHILRWASPWGEGFPGWHIECSAISRKLLGQPFDIHTGGVDHIGVHHENEIAQSTAAFGMPLAHIWMHNEHLLVDGKKMSKSLGNVYTLADIMKKGYPPEAFRYFCMQASYRSLLNFTWEGLDAAQTALKELQKFMTSTFVPAKKNIKISKYRNIEIYKKDFADAISNDLNTPQALAVAWKLIKDSSIPLQEQQRLLLEFDGIFGLGLARHAPKRIPLRVQRLVRTRQEARSNKQFIQSDALRKTLEEVGYGVDDVPEGTIVYKF